MCGLGLAPTSPLLVRLAELEDEALLLEWANDPITRRNGFSPEPISEATHKVWFRTQLHNLEGCRLYIVETANGVPLGQVRFKRSVQAWEVHYSLASRFRGRRLGRRLLESALHKIQTEARGSIIFGRVKVDNRPSRRLFESLGFSIVPDAERGEVLVYQRML